MSDRSALASQRLDTPRSSRFRVNFDAEAVGRVSESIARFLGTGRYLLIQTVIVLVWIALNIVAVDLRWDPYPFILLNLAFSTQAAYAAPLILLAQNRQENRDRVSLEEDRARAEQTKAANLQVLLVVYGYFAYTYARRPHAQKIAGTGLTTPAFA